MKCIKEKNLREKKIDLLAASAAGLPQSSETEVKGPALAKKTRYIISQV